MKVWSIRTKEEVSILERDGYLRTDEKKIDLNFKIPYLWMSKQLRKKITPPENIKYPIWIWQQWLNDKRKKKKT